MSIPIKAMKDWIMEGPADVASAICLLTGRHGERREVLRRLQALRGAYPSAYVRVVSDVARYRRDRKSWNAGRLMRAA